MPSKEPFVRQMDERCAWLKTKIALSLGEYRLIVVAVLRDGHTHRGRLRPPARPTCALLVVLDPWRYVAADYCLQLTDVHAEFHRRRATQQADLAVLEVAFKLFTNAVVDRGGMFLHHHPRVVRTKIKTEVVAFALFPLPL